MSIPDHTTKVFIYLLQRISDKAFIYIGSTNNPQRRFVKHRSSSRYATVKAAFEANDIRFLVISETSEEHRIQVEHDLWKAFIEAGHPIANADPALFTWDYHQIPWNKGKTYHKKNPENRQRHSNETRRKISEALRGRSKGRGRGRSNPMSTEQRQKISEARKGQSLSEETKRKISEANKGKPGHPCSEETKRKVSEANKGRTPWNKGRHIR